MGLGTSFGVYASTDVAAEDGEDTGIAFGGGRGVFGGGVTTNVIDYVTIATPGNATDFGDLTVGSSYLAACSDGTKGVWGGG